MAQKESMPSASIQKQYMEQFLKFVEINLQCFGATEWETGVLHKLHNFTNVYVQSKLDDAKIYSEHAGKQKVDEGDLKLTKELSDESDRRIQREDLLQEAKALNCSPLPPVQIKYGLALPDEEYCLTKCSFKIK